MSAARESIGQYWTSKVSDEVLTLLGIIQAKTYICTSVTFWNHKLHKDPKEYEAVVQQVATNFSGAEIDMQEFCPDKPKWGFVKGESKKKPSLEEQAAKDIADGKVSKAEAIALIKKLESLL